MLSLNKKPMGKYCAAVFAIGQKTPFSRRSTPSFVFVWKYRRSDYECVHNRARATVPSRKIESSLLLTAKYGGITTKRSATMISLKFGKKPLLLYGLNFCAWNSRLRKKFNCCSVLCETQMRSEVKLLPLSDRSEITKVRHCSDYPLSFPYRALCRHTLRSTNASLKTLILGWPRIRIFHRSLL